MNIKSLSTPTQTEPQPGSVMLVSYGKGSATPTEWIADQEQLALERSRAVTQVTNAEEQTRAVEAQATLAMHIRRIQAAEEKAKAPLNALRKKILDLSKQLISKVDEEGNRLGRLVAEFQMAEDKRIAALRRSQDENATELEREKDRKLAQAKSLEEQEQIRDEYNELIAAEAKPLEPARANGQVIREDWDVTVTDVHLLYRHHPNCCKLTPLVSEIKALLNDGAMVKGVTAKKITKAGVRVGKEPEAINV